MESSNRIKLSLSKKLKEYANKMGRDHLGGDDIPGNKKKGGLRDNDGYDNVQYNRDMPQDEARDPNLYYVLYRKIGKSGNPTSAGYESKKDAEKFEKSISKTHTTMVLPKKMVEGMELANEQGVGTATVFLKNQEELDEGGLPQNWMAGRTSDYHTKLRGKKRNYDDTNFAKMNTGQPDIEDEELDPDNEIVNETKPLSKKVKLEIARKLKEYGSRLTNAYILDDESVLDGTPEEKDAINRESAQSKTKKNYKDWKNTNESVSADVYAISRMMGTAQQSTQDFIDDNKIDVKKLKSYIKKLSPVKMIIFKDIVHGSTDKRLRNIKKSFIKQVKESVIDETAKRDYKDEYKKFQSSTKSKKYRAELNKYNRDKGTYGNGDNKDASHKGGKIVGFESQSKNRGRAEKSRLKKK